MPLAPTVYLAGATGRWRIETITPVVGESLPPADRLEIVEAPAVAL
jgi:hypothetical protein